MKRTNWIPIAIFGFVFLLILLAGTTLFGNWNNMGWGMMGGWPTGLMHGWGIGSFGWFGIILMWLIPVGFVVLVALGIIWLVRGFSPTGESSATINQRDESHSSPREILQIRYASGEITRDQYLQMLDDLE